jgi:hypothetical protein
MRVLKINCASISPHQLLIFGYVEDLSIMIILYGIKFLWLGVMQKCKALLE